VVGHKRFGPSTGGAATTQPESRSLFNDRAQIAHNAAQSPQASAQEADGIVVEDVAFLAFRQKGACVMLSIATGIASGETIWSLPNMILLPYRA